MTTSNSGTVAGLVIETRPETTKQGKDKLTVVIETSNEGSRYPNPTRRTAMSNRPIIAIDPGASGGIAWIDGDGTVSAERMPDGMAAQCDRLRSIAAVLGSGAVAVMERVGAYMPGNAGTGAVKFARHCGHLEAALYCFGVPVEQVAPATWMKVCGPLPKGMDPSAKLARKRAIKDAVARRFPRLTVTLSTADALGILWWAMQRREGSKGEQKKYFQGGA